MSLDSQREQQLAELQQIIGYTFKDLRVLNNAMTHSSYITAKNEYMLHNERLEFIGDAILDMIVSLYLFKTHTKLPEGQLTRIRANTVCEQSLYHAASKIDLGRFLLLSKGEENSGGRKRVSTLADAFEALIAAIYLDGGITKAKSFVLIHLKETIELSVQSKTLNDYKTFLQEHVQKHSKGKIAYRMLSESGPDHDKCFEMALYLDDKLIGTGSGHSKKDAQQTAAQKAIESMGIENE